MRQNILQDESGFVVSTELVLIATILILGLIVGHATLRDNIVTELGDSAEALGQLNQSYSIAGAEGFFDGNQVGEIPEMVFNDNSDFCENPNNGVQGTLGGAIVINAGELDGGASTIYSTAN